jgi:hypothetical protein
MVVVRPKDKEKKRKYEVCEGENGLSLSFDLGYVV